MWAMAIRLGQVFNLTRGRLFLNESGLAQNASAPKMVVISWLHWIMEAMGNEASVIFSSP